MENLEVMHGILLTLPGPLVAVAALVGAFALGYFGVSFLGWVGVAFLLLVGFGTPAWLLGALAVPALVFAVPLLRRQVVTARILQVMKAKGLLPTISETERTAIEAGTVWVDQELFSGKPDFRRILAEPYPDLTEKEQAFLDGPVEELCRMTSDWDIWQRRDLPEDVWRFVKEQRFLGMIIPEEYGGLGFSARRTTRAVVTKLSSRSGMRSGGHGRWCRTRWVRPSCSCTTGRRTPRRTITCRASRRGEEVPCFALTEPGAGSGRGLDAPAAALCCAPEGRTARTSCGMRLDWRQALHHAVASISDADRPRVPSCFDPDHLLGRQARTSASPAR